MLETPYELGDVSLHNGWTFHRASPNGAVTPRRVMTVIYMDADITVAEPVNDNQRADLTAWMPGTAVGEIPATYPPLPSSTHPSRARKIRHGRGRCCRAH